jgi:hypothetical protein
MRNLAVRLLAGRCTFRRTGCPVPKEGAVAQAANGEAREMRVATAGRLLPET